MRERGQYQLQLMKTRSSSGVGQKIELDFNIETLRITDSNEEVKQYSQPSPTEILNKIRPNNTVNDVIQNTVQPQTGKVVADVQSSKLKSLLNSLQKQNQ